MEARPPLGFPIATRAQDAVAILVEMLADEAARQTAGDATLAEAILLVDTTGTAGAALGAPKDLRTPEQRRFALAARESRLVATDRTVGRGARLLVTLLSAALVVVPPALILSS